MNHKPISELNTMMQGVERALKHKKKKKHFQVRQERATQRTRGAGIDKAPHALLIRKFVFCGQIAHNKLFNKFHYRDPSKILEFIK